MVYMDAVDLLVAGALVIGAVALLTLAFLVYALWWGFRWK
jgi:hypothetical protein